MAVIQVNRSGIVFCRLSTVALLAVAMLLHNKPLVVLVVVMMAIPAALTVRYAPVYLLYNRFLAGLAGSKSGEVDAAAIRFAQGFGAFLLLLALANFYAWHSDGAGWMFVGAVAGSTAFGAAGHCVGAYVYYGLRWMVRRIVPQPGH